MRNKKISIPSPFCFQTEMTVQVSDINYGGHVGNERYLLFAQETRMRFLATIGCSEMHFGPFGLALTEAHVEYFHELFHGNTIRISLAIGTLSRASFDCFYLIKLLKNEEIYRLSFITNKKNTRIVNIIYISSFFFESRQYNIEKRID